MTCFSPMYAIHLPDIKSSSGKDFVKILGSAKTYSSPPVNKITGEKAFIVPCGQCIGCRLDYSKSWAARCVLEASLHERNCFITLTYAPEFLPENGSLVKRDLQLFMKRLRKRFSDERIRFFACGEYGSKNSRPHYHLLIFGFDFPDKTEFFKSKYGDIVYRSSELEKLWTFGISSIGDVTYNSCAYVARYILKKQSDSKTNIEIHDRFCEHYNDRIPEFTLMSRRPGIARDWFDKFKSDVYSHDFLVVRDKIQRPPRYFDKIYESENPSEFESIKNERFCRATSVDFDPAENDRKQKFYELMASRRDAERCVE